MSFISLPFPTAAFLDLAKFLREKGSDRDPVKTVEEAVNYWIENADWKEDLLSETIRSNQGYNWKGLFLPSRTLLRMRNDGTFHYAEVVGDDLTYHGQRASPNQFALAVAGHARDAWRDIWIKRPADPDYRLADDLRQEKARNSGTM